MNANKLNAFQFLCVDDTAIYLPMIKIHEKKYKYNE